MNDISKMISFQFNDFIEKWSNSNLGRITINIQRKIVCLEIRFHCYIKIVFVKL